MTINHAVWTVGPKPEALTAATLPSEQVLEDMIVAAPQIISNDWLLIGRQERTTHGGRIDLLAIAPDGGLVLIEIKRDRTSREVVAQALDYASWVETLQPDEIAAIYGRFAPGRNLSVDFLERFGQPLDEEQLNHDHEVVIVAATLDADSQRIVEYLAAREIQINVLSFQVFVQGTQQFISRAWLLDPVLAVPTDSKTSLSQPSEIWNGEYYASFGDGPDRSWTDAVRYGFISAGGGPWYTKTLGLLNVGDRVWVKVPGKGKGKGYVGVGRVSGLVEPLKTFQVKNDLGVMVPLIDAAHNASYGASLIDDLEQCEYFVRIDWLDTVPLEAAVDEIGLFGNQNSVCRPTKPKWRSTVERLKLRFTKAND